MTAGHEGIDRTAAGFDPTADPRAFRTALGRFATGVAVVTVPSAEGPVGITANSFASVSLDPPLVLWSPAKASNRFVFFARAPHYAIHVLDRGQRPLAEAFTRAKDAFAGLDWHAGPGGVPLIADCLARFECRLEAAHDAGDHLILVGRVTRAAYRDGAPLVFQASRFLDTGP